MSTIKTFLTVLLTGVPMVVAPAAHASIQEDFDSGSWTDDWSWTTTTSGGASNWSAQQSGSELALSVLAGSGYDSGTLTHNTGVDPQGDGVAGNAAGIVEATFKMKWTTGSMRMYPQFRLYNAPGSNDYLHFHFLADGREVGNNSGRAIIYVGGDLEREEGFDTTVTEPEGSYGWFRWFVDVDERRAKLLESTDGTNWTTVQNMLMTGSVYDEFFNDMGNLTPEFAMVFKNDSTGAADRSVTLDSITVEAVPEPGSLALLGLGALALASRRRG